MTKLNILCSLHPLFENVSFEEGTKTYSEMGVIFKYFQFLCKSEERETKGVWKILKLEDKM